MKSIIKNLPREIKILNPIRSFFWMNTFFRIYKRTCLTASLPNGQNQYLTSNRVKNFILLKQNISQGKKGIGLVEMVVGLSVFIFIVLSFIVSFNYFIKNSILGTKTVQAYFLAEEGMEAIKSMRNDGWTTNINSLISGQEYYFYFNGSRWESTTAQSTIDNLFTRKFTLENVYRNISGDISSSGVLDSGSKKVNVSVSYAVNEAVITKNLSMIITNIFGN